MSHWNSLKAEITTLLEIGSSAHLSRQSAFQRGRRRYARKIEGPAAACDAQIPAFVLVLWRFLLGTILVGGNTSPGGSVQASRGGVAIVALPSVVPGSLLAQFAGKTTGRIALVILRACTRAGRSGGDQFQTDALPPLHYGPAEIRLTNSGRRGKAASPRLPVAEWTDP